MSSENRHLTTLLLRKTWRIWKRYCREDNGKQFKFYKLGFTGKTNSFITPFSIWLSLKYSKILRENHSLVFEEWCYASIWYSINFFHIILKLQSLISSQFDPSKVLMTAKSSFAINDQPIWFPVISKFLLTSHQSLQPSLRLCPTLPKFNLTSQISPYFSKFLSIVQLFQLWCFV